jgi:UDP-N-acetylmuramoylalanine--D-glutamate ligase
MDASAYFRGKKITVMGLGLLGRGVGDAAYLASCGAELIVTDLKTSDALATSVELLKEFSNITLVLGEHRLEDFRDRDFILKAAGVPLDSPCIIEAQNEGVPIKMSASLFAEVAQIPVVGVTGTRGKSTVTHMLHEIYKKAGKPVLLGGNVRGVSTLALLNEVTPEHTALFELDSWQLQGFGEAGFSPSISVFTTFFPDHLNYYHDNLDVYLADKANIFLYQTPEDTLVLGSQAAPIVIEKYGEVIESKVKVVGEANLPSDWALLIPGEHNRYDAALALAAARASNIPDEVTRAALENFAGVPGRLELVGTTDGIAFYNDTTATTPEATLAALRALAGENATDEASDSMAVETHKPRIVLIMGGNDKGLDMQPLLDTLPKYTKHIALLAGTGTETVRASLPDAEVYDNLAMAFADARAHADPGDVVLLSPAFSSFGMFTNEYDRGDQFNNLVNEYAN